MKKLKAKLLELQKMGYESVLITDVLQWIRTFEPIHSDEWIRRKMAEEKLNDKKSTPNS